MRNQKSNGRAGAGQSLTHALSIIKFVASQSGGATLFGHRQTDGVASIHGSLLADHASAGPFRSFGPAGRDGPSRSALSLSVMPICKRGIWRGQRGRSFDA
jgi:hypothetical protein